MSGKSIKPKDFEDALKQLETVVQDLEAGELSLEKSLERYEHGVKLARYCHLKLEEAEKRVAVLRTNEEGEPLKDAAGALREVELKLSDSQADVDS